MGSYVSRLFGTDGESEFDLENVYVVTLNTVSNEEITNFLYSLEANLLRYVNFEDTTRYWRVSFSSDPKGKLDLIRKQPWCKWVGVEAVVEVS